MLPASKFFLNSTGGLAEDLWLNFLDTRLPKLELKPVISNPRGKRSRRRVWTSLYGDLEQNDGEAAWAASTYFVGHTQSRQKSIILEIKGDLCTKEMILLSLKFLYS